MKCDRTRELFSEYLEGALERPMAVALERHMAECPDCEREYSAFRLTWQMLESLPEVAPRPGFASGVVMELTRRREAERRERVWWKQLFGGAFTARVPARAWAAAAAAAILIAGAAIPPVRDTVGATLGIRPVTTPQVHAEWKKVEPGMAWLESGLSFELDSSSTQTGWSVFRLLLKPKDTTNEQVKVFIMEPGKPNFDADGIRRAKLIFDGDVQESGQVIPFVLGQSTEKQGVATALIQWEHRRRTFTEAVFVPMKMNSGSGTAVGSVRIEGTELYTALQEISSAFGVVVLANGDINQMVKGVNVSNGPADDAIHQVAENTNLRWRPLGARVYVIERRFE